MSIISKRDLFKFPYNVIREFLEWANTPEDTINIEKVLEDYYKHKEDVIEPFNGFCKNCDIPFIRCTFKKCPDCGMPIIPDPKEEEESELDDLMCTECPDGFDSQLQLNLHWEEFHG